MMADRFDFSGAVTDAMLLLDYASRHGIEVDAKTKEAVLKADSSQGASTSLNDRDRQSFWQAFTSLAKALQPVTPDSIKYTNGEGVKGIARRRVQVPLYVCISMFSLLVLIVVQIFWVGGTSLVSDVDASLHKVQSLQGKLVEQEVALKPEGPLTTPDIDRMYVELRASFAMLQSHHESLHKWNVLWSRIPWMDPPFESSTYPQYDIPTRANVDIASAKLFLNALYTYLLPLLYGWLGACFYVLRTIRAEIKSWTFTSHSSISYLLRMTLGPLAGLAVGMMVSDDSTSLFTLLEGTAGKEGGGVVPNLTVLGPLSIAFLAGYGIELLFASMDRIIGAFTQQPNSNHTK